MQLFLWKLGLLLALSRLCLQLINAAPWSGNLSWWLPLWLSSLSPSLCSPRRTASAALTPERAQVWLLYLKESGGWKEAHSGTSALEQTRSLHAEKKTKCQGWLRETAAGAAMETAVEYGCRGWLPRSHSLKMSKHPKVGVEESRLDLITINLFAFFCCFSRAPTQNLLITETFPGGTVTFICFPIMIRPVLLHTNPSSEDFPAQDSGAPLHLRHKQHNKHSTCIFHKQQDY